MYCSCRLSRQNFLCQILCCSVQWVFDISLKRTLVVQFRKKEASLLFFRYLFNMYICRGVLCTEDNKKGVSILNTLFFFIDRANIHAVLSAEWLSNVFKTINKELTCKEETFREWRSEIAAVSGYRTYISAKKCINTSGKCRPVRAAWTYKNVLQIDHVLT